MCISRYGSISRAVGLLLLAFGLHEAWPVRSAAAQTATPSVQIPLQRYALSNGLEVILLVDHSIPLVHVDVTYHVGSGNEPPRKSGLAHLFEHLMFQGSEHVGEDMHDPILRAAGAHGVNGSTNTDRTNYYESLPANQLETALWLESDRMGYLLPTLTQRSLDNQREVVRNERRMNYENVAYGEETFAIGLGLYPEGHPYRHLTIGLDEDLERASLDDVQAFFARWYVPSNATLLIAGDIDIPQTKALVDKWFGTFPRARKPQVTPPARPSLPNKTRKTLTDRLATLRRIHYVWPSPAGFQPGDSDLDLLALVLGSTSGRLRKALVVDRSLARSVFAHQQSRRFSSEFHVVVDLHPEASLQDTEAIISAEIAKLKTQLVQPRELKQAVAQFVANFVRGLETLEARSSRLQYYANQVGNPDFVAKDLERYRNGTPESLRAIAHKVLTDKRLEIITLPETGGQ